MAYLTKYELFYSGEAPRLKPDEKSAVCNHPYIENETICPVCGQKMVKRHTLDVFHEVLFLLVPDLDDYQSWSDWELTMLAISRDFPDRELLIYGSGEKEGDEWGCQFRKGKQFRMIYNPDFGRQGHQIFDKKALTEMTRITG